MPAPRAIIEFQETHCEVFVWENEKANSTLKVFFRIPLEKSENKGDTPVTDSPAVQANASALRHALRETGLKIRDALVVIPKQWVTLRVVTLPTTEPSELADMARFEAQRYIPFNVERHIISYHVLSVEGIGGTRVILAAIDSPPAEEIVAIMEAAGIRISALDVSTTALCNALLSSGQWNSAQHSTVAQLHIGHTSTDINILHKGQLIFARSIGVGIDKLFTSASPEAVVPRDVTPDMIAQVDLLRAEESVAGEGSASTAMSPAQVQTQWASRLMTETRRTYEFAHREFECEPLSQVFISGPGAVLRNLDKVIQSSLGTEPLPLDLFTNRLVMDRETLPSALSPLSYAVGVGGMLRDLESKGLRVNLLPPAYVAKYQGVRRKQSLITTGVLAAALLVFLALFFVQHVHQRREMLEFYQKAVETSEERVKEIQYRKTVVRILRENSSQKSSALAILNTLSGWNKVFGGERMRASIEEFIYDTGDGVTLIGWAWEYADLNDLITELEKSGHFRKVSTTNRPIENFPGQSQQVVKFGLKCHFDSKTASADAGN